MTNEQPEDTAPDRTDAAPADPASASDPADAGNAAGPARSTRRLDRAPGERYAPRVRGRSAATPDDAPAGVRLQVGGSVGRAAVFSVPAAIVALIVYLVFAGPLAFSAGLVVIGVFAGRMIGLTAKAGGGTRVPSDERVVVALVVTLVWFIATQVGVWLYARNEGGVLSVLDYLLQTFGPIVPLVAIASILAAWWSAR